MNKKDLLLGFKICREEIESLRRENQLLRAENKAFNRVLSALESHRPSDLAVGHSEDILWRIRNTEELLDKEIASERQAENENKVKFNESAEV